MGIFSLLTGLRGPSGFGSSSTAEEVTQGIDARNQTVIITGGASGIGLETARVLALRKAHVIIAARNTDAAITVKQLILRENVDARVDVLKLDLASISSIHEFVRNFNALQLPLNILINNAGIMACPFQLTEYGVEMQFATNHLGHFLLTKMLIDKMKDTARHSGIVGRIVNLTSIAHKFSYKEGMRFDKLNDSESYSSGKAYGQSKLANLLHAKELSRRLEQEGANLTVNAVHPGMISTNLLRHFPYTAGLVKLLTFLLWKNVPQGAATTCYVALHPSVEGITGKYFVDCNEEEPNDHAKDETLAKALWDYSEKIVAAAST